MKIVADEANWFIKPYDHTTKEAYLFAMKTPIVRAWQKNKKHENENTVKQISSERVDSRIARNRKVT